MNTIIIRKKLKSATINLGKEVETLVGKNVEIVISEVLDTQPVERKWTMLGSVNLDRGLDHVNIRDFAHDD